MGHFKELKNAIDEKDFKYLEWINFKLDFLKTYQSKKYDQLNEKGLSVIFQTKLVIGLSWFEKLKSQKIFLEVFMCLKSLKQAVKKENLLELGFKSTTLKCVIKKMLKWKILDNQAYQKDKTIKLRKKVLKTKTDKKFWILKGEKIVKFFLLNGLSSTIVILASNYCYKKAKFKDSRLQNSNKKWAVIQNAYFDCLKVSRSFIWKSFKRLVEFLKANYKSLITVIRKRPTNWITKKTVTGKNKKIKVGRKFITERFISKEVKKIFQSYKFFGYNSTN
ncbi:integrative conjugal element protein [Mycoplasma capricolum subsp. capricolum]|uniref:MAGa4850 family ICE element protein n=1 Tax=Mycoplasma capricolum TaxID=2095 RepID=UPI003DA26467